MTMQATLLPIKQQPFGYAHVCLITGDQGSGKSNTGVAKVVDAYWRDAVRIYCEEVLKIKCLIRSYNHHTRVAKIVHDGILKSLLIPRTYKLKSPMRIFANFHIYGIPSVYCSSFQQTMEWLKNGTICNGWLLIDEYYIGGNARESMTALGKELEKQSFQFRKMHLEVVVLCPLDRLADWTMRTIVTERISCSYEEKTHRITLQIKKRGIRGTKEISYDATQYWGNYFTDERITK